MRGKTKVVWCGEIGEKDDFGAEIGDSFVDGRTRMGPWAIMSSESFAEHGIKLGTGFGQLYSRVGNEWVKVQG